MQAFWQTSVGGTTIGTLTHIHSYLKESTGLAVAALMGCVSAKFRQGMALLHFLSSTETSGMPAQTCS
jgi:hypothetical protein